MQKLFTAGFLVVLSIFLSFNVSYAIGISSDDLWDISNDVSVTGNSEVLGPPIYESYWSSDIRDIFGGKYAPIERGNTIFQDYMAKDTANWVEWQTVNPVTINYYNLVAAHDGDSSHRGISKFLLYAWSGTSWSKLDEYITTDPYGGGPTYTGAHFLELYRAVPMTSADKFRAEFIQYGIASSVSGSRICELDGYFVPIAAPEPVSMLLFGLGGGVLALVRRKKRT